MIIWKSYVIQLEKLNYDVPYGHNESNYKLMNRAKSIPLTHKGMDNITST